MDAYLEALGIEMAGMGTRPVVDTIFVGGGTPSHLPLEQLEKLLRLIAERFEPAPARSFPPRPIPIL